MCPASIADKYIVCLACLPKYKQWRNGKRAIRAKSMAAAVERRAPAGSEHRPWGGVFDETVPRTA